MAKEVEELLDRYYEDASEQDVENIRANMVGMNRGPIAEIWDKVMALWNFIADPRKGWAAKALAIAALVYLIMPLDVVPDFIPVLGLLDDVSVILAAVAALDAELG